MAASPRRSFGEKAGVLSDGFRGATKMAQLEDFVGVVHQLILCIVEMAAMVHSQSFQWGGPVEGHGSGGPPVNQEHIVFIQHREAADRSAIAVLVGGVAERQGLAHCFQFGCSAEANHGASRSLANQCGPNGGVGFGVFVDNVANAFFGGLGRFGSQRFGLAASSVQMGAMNGLDVAKLSLFSQEFG